MFTCLSDSGVHALKLKQFFSLEICCSGAIRFSMPQILPEDISLPAPSSPLEYPFSVVQNPILGHLQREKTAKAASDFQSGPSMPCDVA